MIVLYDELVLHVAYFFAMGILIMPIIGFLWNVVVSLLWSNTFK